LGFGNGTDDYGYGKNGSQYAVPFAEENDRLIRWMSGKAPLGPPHPSAAFVLAATRASS
jgi:hypothetical protein